MTNKNIFIGPTQKDIEAMQERIKQSDKRFKKKVAKMMKKIKRK